VTAAAPPMRSAPASDHDWVAAYEDLRRTALEADGRAGRVPGIAVVLRAGVAAWMQACRTVVGLTPAVPPGGKTMGGLPGPVRAEVAVVLTQMALAAATEMAT
jgi:hypothetical protein